MMKQTSPSLAIYFKLLMTVIMFLVIYLSCWSTGCDIQGHVTVQMTRGVGWRRHSLGEEGALSCRPHGGWTAVLCCIVWTHRRNLHDSSSVQYVYPQTGETTAYHGLSCQCHQQTWISTFTYKLGPSNIPILKYYWDMKDVIICPCIDSVLLRWMDVISYWCPAKARRPTIAVTKKTVS